MKKELKQLVKAAEVYADFQSIGNGAKLQIAIDNGKKVLLKYDTIKSNREDDECTKCNHCGKKNCVAQSCLDD